MSPLSTRSNRNITWGILGMGIGLLGLTLVWVLLTTLGTAKSINDCLQLHPQGRCKEVQEQQAKQTIDLIVRINVYSLTCRQQEPLAGDEELTRCVNAKLARSQ